MSNPNQPGDPYGDHGASQQPGTPPPYGYPGYPGQPYPYQYPIDPQAPYGRDPATGQPLSDKSAVAAGCLQLFFGVLGIGRFYIGSTALGGIQLCLGVFSLFFTLFCFVGAPFLLGVVIWTVIDAIMIFTGSVTDRYGRKLR